MSCGCLAAIAYAASFHCSRALAAEERFIGADEGILALDIRMGEH